MLLYSKTRAFSRSPISIPTENDRNVSANLLRFYGQSTDVSSLEGPVPDSAFQPILPTYRGTQPIDPIYDLLRQMLSWNPQGRITASNALRHRFFTETDAKTPLFNAMRDADREHDRTAALPVIFDASWEEKYTCGPTRRFLDHVFPNQEALHVLEILTGEWVGVGQL